MTIGRFSIGFWRKPGGAFDWGLRYTHANCGCHLLQIGCLGFDWLSEECAAWT